MEAPSPENNPKKPTQSWLSLVSLGFQMLATILFCVWVGILLDNWIQNTTPWATLFFSLFGCGVAMTQIIMQYFKSLRP